MPAVVVDASATLGWLFGEDDPSGWLANQLASGSLAAPAHWRLEVVNGIVVKERMRHITQAQGEQFLQILDVLAIDIIPPRVEQTLLPLAALARPHPLTAYDAVYLDLAMSTGASLLTLDNNLEAAARRVGTPLIGG